MGSVLFLPLYTGLMKTAFIVWEPVSNGPAIVHLSSFPKKPLNVPSSQAGNLLLCGRPAHWTRLPTNQAASSVLRKLKCASVRMWEDGHQSTSGVVTCDDPPHSHVKCSHQGDLRLSVAARHARVLYKEWILKIFYCLLLCSLVKFLCGV